MRKISLLALPLLVPLASACGADDGHKHLENGVSMLGFGSLIQFMIIVALGLFIAVMIKILMKGGKS